MGTVKWYLAGGTEQFVPYRAGCQVVWHVQSKININLLTNQVEVQPNSCIPSAKHKSCWKYFCEGEEDYLNYSLKY